MEFVCRETTERYAVDACRWRSDPGGVLDLEFESQFDLNTAQKAPPNMWRYIDALPISEGASRVTFGEGMTPLVPMHFSGQEVFFKFDFMFPSGSYKDRGSAVMISHAKSLGVERVVQDSSGNGGASVACYCAKAGIACEIYVPEGTSPAKTSQISAYGATCRLIPGSREDTAAAAQEAARSTFYASHVWNPFFCHGVKTYVFEMFEQMGQELPDAIVVPVGNGTLVIGAHLAFQDLQKAGLIQSVPRIIAVQAANCSPLVSAFANDLTVPELVETTPTLGEGIAIAAPARGEQILKVIRESAGDILPVSEEEIGIAWREMASKGMLIEPTSAVTVAGLKAYLARDRADHESIACVLTGHGMKTADKTGELLGKVPIQ